MDRAARFYVTSVSSATVLLSPESGTTTPQMPAGTGVQQITITTRETTADANFWGTTGACGRFLVTFEKLT